MDPEKTIDIGIKTEADTKGADDAKKALNEVEKAAQDAQRKQDVETAQQRVAAREAKAHAEALREIADGQQRLIAANLAGAVGEIGKQFRGVNDELDMVLDGTQNFLSVLASTGDPIKAVLAMAGTAIDAVFNAERDASAAMKAGQDKVKESFEKLQRARAQWAQQVKTEKLEDYFRREAEALEDQEAALGRIVKLREAQRNLENAQQRASGAAATRSGGDPFASEAQGLFSEQSNSIKAIQDSLEASRKEVDQARSYADDLNSRLQLIKETEGSKSALAEEAANKARDADRQYQKLADALPDLERIAQLDIAKIKVDFETSMGELSDKAGRDLAEKAKAQIEAVQAKAAESGEGVSMTMQGIIANISQIVSDGMVESKELPALREQLQRIATTRESNDKEIYEGFSKVVRSTETLTSLLPALKSRIATLEADVAVIKNAPQ